MNKGTISGDDGFYVNDQHIYYSCRITQRKKADYKNKYIVRKCTYDGTVVAKYDQCGNYIVCTGEDDEGYVYVLCKNLEVIKLDKNLKHVKKTSNDCALYLRETYGMLVLSENVLVISEYQRICVLDLNLNFCYTLSELKIAPIGFAKFQTNKFIVTSKSAIEVFEINFQKEN